MRILLISFILFITACGTYKPNEFMYNGLAFHPQSEKCDVDTDKDGVSDCFDRCKKTPTGVAVDTHGCPMDTDGDGVADYKDKELITPSTCQPSDSNGVGNCSQK